MHTHPSSAESSRWVTPLSRKNSSCEFSGVNTRANSYGFMDDSPVVNCRRSVGTEAREAARRPTHTRVRARTRTHAHGLAVVAGQNHLRVAAAQLVVQQRTDAHDHTHAAPRSDASADTRPPDPTTALPSRVLRADPPFALSPARRGGAPRYAGAHARSASPVVGHPSASSLPRARDSRPLRACSPRPRPASAPWVPAAATTGEEKPPRQLSLRNCCFDAGPRRFWAVAPRCCAGCERPMRAVRAACRGDGLRTGATDCVRCGKWRGRTASRCTRARNPTCSTW